jgi:phosphoribosyl-ATP pyrophosphohydrolase/phosphoribosyl-AMP cyclohydrolase
MGELIPAIIQDATSGMVLMLGYMNQAALQKTLETQWVTFYSRSKNRLWMKGEESGNKLQLVHIAVDCDQDTLLIHANPTGPVCHTGDATCFHDAPKTDWDFVQQLERVIATREQSRDKNSYVASLFNAGTSKIAQKVGEEAVEVALAALDKDDEGFCGEAADLLFHLLILLKARQVDISRVISVLRERS